MKFRWFLSPLLCFFSVLFFVTTALADMQKLAVKVSLPGQTEPGELHLSDREVKGQFFLYLAYEIHGREIHQRIEIPAESLAMIQGWMKAPENLSASIAISESGARTDARIRDVNIELDEKGDFLRISVEASYFSWDSKAQKGTLIETPIALNKIKPSEGFEIGRAHV